MDNFTVNLNITESSTNTSTPVIGIIFSLFICLYSINVLFGLPTHFYVIWLIIRGAENGFAFEFFNLNLSVCEIGICLNYVFKLLEMWFSNLQTVSYFLHGLVITGRPLFHCLICVERYLAVVHPVTFLKYKPLRYRLMCSAAVWIISLGSSVCCMFLGLFLHALELLTWIFSVQSLLFLSIQLFCCVAVLRALKQSGPGERGREREEENHMKRRAFHLILITTVSMFVTYISLVFSGFYSIMTRQYIVEVYVVSFVCFGFAGFVQPVLYLHRAGKLTCFSSPVPAS